MLLEGDPRFDIGQRKKGRGPWPCDYRKTCVLVEWGQYESIVENLHSSTLYVGSRKVVGPRNLERAQRHGFEVGRISAFPAVFRKESGVDFRSPDAAELERLEACLWVIPLLLKRAGCCKPGVSEFAFNGPIS